MRTVIVRLVEPEQAGGQLRGLFQELGGQAVPFHGAEALIQLLAAAADRPPRPARSPDQPD